MKLPRSTCGLFIALIAFVFTANTSKAETFETDFRKSVGGFLNNLTKEQQAECLQPMDTKTRWRKQYSLRVAVNTSVAEDAPDMTVVIPQPAQTLATIPAGRKPTEFSENPNAQNPAVQIIAANDRARPQTEVAASTKVSSG